MYSDYERFLGGFSETRKITINNPITKSKEDVYNFDTKVIRLPNQNPGVLFQNTYNDEDQYRSSFLLSMDGIDSLISLLTRARAELLYINEYKAENRKTIDILKKLIQEDLVESIDIKYMKPISSEKKFSPEINDYINYTFIHKFNIHVRFDKKRYDQIIKIFMCLLNTKVYRYKPLQLLHFNFSIYTNIIQGDIEKDQEEMMKYHVKSLLGIEDLFIPINLINLKKGNYHDKLVSKLMVNDLTKLRLDKNPSLVDYVDRLPVPTSDEIDEDQFAEDLKELIKEMKGEDTDVSDEVSEDERKF